MTDLNINGINVLDFTSGVSSVSVTDDVASIAISAGSGLTLQTNGTPNGDQTLLNLAQGGAITVTDNGSGTVTIGGGGTGTVTHTGALAAGQLLKGNGADDITVGDLTGDVTTSGTVGTTLAKIQTKTLTITSPTTNDILTYNGTSWVNGTVSSLPNANASKIQSVSVSTVTPQNGDTLRYNEYADTKWDLTTALPQFHKFCGNLTAVGVTALPADGSNPDIGGTNTLQAATATEPTMQRFAGSAGGSTNLVAYVEGPFATNVGHQSMGVFHRYSCRARMNNTTNARYWLGVSEVTSVRLTSLFSTDTPNVHYAMFRYSNGTDTTIKAVTATDNSHQTVVDTGVSVDTTNSKLFEIAWDGTNATFFLDGVQVAQISTNVPTAATLIGMVQTLDNKNNATAMSFDFAYSQMTLKQ